MTIKPSELQFICNGCGELMRFHGEWPVQYPKTEDGHKTYNVQQAYRWSCGTCRMKHPNYEHGIGVYATVLKLPDQLDEGWR
jgi:hypothetical protein